MGLDSPPQPPPSKSSPPAKRSKSSPTYPKASPAIIGNSSAAHHPNHAARATIDEKLESMPIQRVSQMDLNNVTSAYAGAAAYANQATFGTMFQHASFGPPPGMHNPPPLQMPQPPPPPQPQSSMYGGGPANSGGQMPYGPPQPIPTHYQTGSGPSHQQQQYYQHQPSSGRGGYYQGPP